MIDLKSLAEQITSTLNSGLENPLFKIFADTGDFIECVRAQDSNVVEETINGLLTITESEIVPVNGLSVATQSSRLEFIFPVGDDALYIEESVAEVRNHFAKAFENPLVWALTDGDDEEAKTYCVSVVGSIAATGTRGMVQPIGDSMSLVAWFRLAFIENGVNSYNCEVRLDGYKLPFTGFHMSRTAQLQGNAYSDTNGVSKARKLASSLTFEIQMPQTTDEPQKALMCLLDDDNATHELWLSISGFVRRYNVVFGDTTLSLEGVENAGIVFYLAEVR